MKLNCSFVSKMNTKSQRDKRVKAQILVFKILVIRKYKFKKAN